MLAKSSCTAAELCGGYGGEDLTEGGYHTHS
jgi:hypothetical protein